MSRSVLFLTLFLSIHTFAGASKDEWVLANPKLNSECPPTGVAEIHADFDGDGKADVARLQVNKKTKRQRLAIWLNDAAQPLVVYEGEDGNGDIAKVLPGKYKSLDGLEQSDLHVNLPSINFAPDCGAYNVVYQWDKKTKKFLKSETGD